MARHSTGLRNRYRNGKGPYHKRSKALTADRYAKYVNGEKKTSDVIAKYVRNVDAEPD